MKMTSFIAFLILFILADSALAAGPSLVEINIDSHAEATIAGSVVSSALARSGNRFICHVTDEQASRLNRSGIEVNLVFEADDLSELYLVRQKSIASLKVIDPKNFGEVYDLEPGVSISRMSRMAAASLEDDSHYFVNHLGEFELRITYLSPVITSLMAQIDDYPSDSVALRINLDSIYAFDTRLEAFETRYIGTDSIDAARDWIAQKFVAFGYTDVTTPTFSWDGGTHYNVMAVKQGFAEPDRVIVIGGHYDSIVYGQPRPPTEFAPGSDDNASGTALVLELARIFADIPFRKTIIFMAFSAEEVGLVGSAAAAADFVAAGTDVEVMFNYDMVGYDPSSGWEISISAGANTAYRDLAITTNERVTPLDAVLSSSPGSSDHASFRSQGFNIVNNIETDFNYPGWHTELDLSANMNFPYFTDVVRGAAASIAIIADAASPTEVTAVYDGGDGQSVVVHWSPCDPAYEYVLYYGPSFNINADSILVASGSCSQEVSGLTEGVSYHFGVIGTLPGSYPALYAIGAWGESFVNPRIPGSFEANPALGKISLTWEISPELDFSHYQIYRMTTGIGSFSLYEDNVTASFYDDNNALGQVGYSYIIVAVDTDGNESGFSEQVYSVAATFDAGVLLVDEVTTTSGVPSQEGQVAFYDSLFGPIQYDMISIDGEFDRLSRSKAGQYSSIFWFDDEISTRKFISGSADSIDWYVDFADNMLIAGFRTIEIWYGSPLSPGNVLYDDFKLSSYVTNNAHEFAGATGENGWPSVVVDSTNRVDFMPYIPILTLRAGAEVIYRYDSKNDDPAKEGLPCGIIYDSPNGKRVLLSFPLMHLEDGYAEAVIAHALTLFGEQEVVSPHGDVNRSGLVNVADIVYLVAYLFGNGPAPVAPNMADVNGSCTINISDVTYLVSYLFGIPLGAAPQQGCVQ